MAGAALWRHPSSFCVAGAALQTCRVACFLRIALAGLRQVVTTCKFHGRGGILWHVLKIDARNIDFEVEHFHVHEKTRRKTPILKLQSLKVGGSLARNARFEAPTCLVSILWFSPAGAVSIWGKLQHLSLPKVSKAVLISFCVACVAGVALHDILMCLKNSRKSFCVTCAILLQGFQKTTCIFRDRHSTLDLSIFILRGRRSTLDVSCCVFLANRIVRAVSGDDNVQIAWQAWGMVSASLRGEDPSFCLAGAVFGTLWTLHFTLDTWHSTLCSLHSTLRLYTSHFYTWHPALYTLHFTLYIALHSPHSTLHTLHSALHTLHFTLRSTLHTLHSTLYTRHFALHNPHFIAYTLNPPLNTPLSSLSSHSILCTPAHVALHSLHWYGSRGKMYKTVEIICFTKMFYVPAFGFIGFSFFLTLLVVHFYYMYPHKTP